MKIFIEFDILKERFLIHDKNAHKISARASLFYFIKLLISI